MAQVDVADETWIAAPVQQVAVRLADPTNWRHWWPDLDLVVDELRGLQGVRWFVQNAHGGTGSMEVWLAPDRDGVRVHYFLRLDAPDGQRLSGSHAERLALGHRQRAKQVFWGLKDELEAR